MKPHLFQYTADGNDYGFENYAEDEKDAKRRLHKMAFSQYMGIKYAEFAVKDTWTYGLAVLIGFVLASLLL